MSDNQANFATIAVCYNMLYRSKYPRKPSVVSHVVDQLIIWGGGSKKLIEKFNKLKLTNSYAKILDKNKEMGEEHDEDALEWKREVETFHNRNIFIEELQSTTTLNMEYIQNSALTSQHYDHDVYEFVKQQLLEASPDIFQRTREHFKNYVDYQVI